MNTKDLPPELIQALLNKPKHVSQNVNLKCECGETLDNGYCRNESCEVDAPIPTYECEHCGHCPDPKHCVFSVTCPVCHVPPGIENLCREGTRLVALHLERHELAKVS